MAIFYQFILTAFLFLMVSPGGAHARLPDWCIPEKPPRLKMTPETDRINFIYSESSDTLSHFDIDTISPYTGQQVKTRVGGLSEGTIEDSIRIQLGYVANYTDETACLSYSQIEVLMRIKPTVYIAKEHQPGTCMHEAIKEHELKHVRVDREIVNEYLEVIGGALRENLKDKGYIVGPMPIKKTSAMKQAMQNRVTSVIKPYVIAMQQERLSRQQQIDTLEEYERVSTACD